MENLIIIAILAAIGAAAAVYIIRAKKRGEKCIGCPHGKNCSGGCGGCGGEQPESKSKEN